MKKVRIIAVMAALIVSLSGCANTDHPQAIQDSSGIETVTSETYEHTEPKDYSSASVSESKESTADSTATVKAETESARVENSQPAAEQSPAPGTQSPQTVVPNNTPKPETPKAVEPTPEPKPETPKAVEPTPEPKPETPQQLTPELVQPASPQETTPATEESAVSEFDIDYWISFAKSYALSIGLELSTAAVECWDNPMIAGAHSKYLERDITDCLNCYKNIEDFTGVWVWAEPDGNGAYKLYIGYE